MCYFLHGAINKEINIGDYDKIIKNSSYHFNRGDINDVNQCIENQSFQYRITFNHCDCDTPIGQGEKNKNEIGALVDLLTKLKSVRGIKYVLISKNWFNEPNAGLKTVHIDDVDISDFLANMEDNSLYKIELYKKYYDSYKPKE